MVENPVLLDLQHLGRFLWLRFILTLFSRFYYAEFQSFRIASVMQEKTRRFGFNRNLKWDGVYSKESLMLAVVQKVDFFAIQFLSFKAIKPVKSSSVMIYLISVYISGMPLQIINIVL